MGGDGYPYKIKRPKPDAHLAVQVMNGMLEHWDFEEFDEYKVFLARGTRGQQAIFASSCYFNDVFNGGHEQFFSNSTGMMWQDALDGLKTIGATHSRKVLSDAVASFPKSEPATDQESRLESMERISQDVWRPLDEALFAAGGEFEDCSKQYIESHPEEFFI